MLQINLINPGSCERALVLFLQGTRIASKVKVLLLMLLLLLWLLLLLPHERPERKMDIFAFAGFSLP